MAPKGHSTQTMPGASAPFVKQLAASDRPTRDAAVEALKQFLGGKRQFTRLDFIKLWKGLYFTMWYCDRPIPQQRLAQTLADLVGIVRENNVKFFLQAFWETMAREWEKTDSLRMNKYLMLVRRYVNATFLYLDKRSYPENLLSDIIETLALVPLNSTDRKYPDGLRLHVLDVFLDELGHYLPKNEEGEPVECDEETKQRIQKFLEPVEELSIKYLSPLVKKRAKEAVLEDARLKAWLGKKDNESDDDDDEDDWHGIQD